MLAKNKTVKKKVLLALIISLILLSLAGFGWLTKKSIEWKKIVEPTGKRGIEAETESRLREFAFKEELTLLARPELRGKILIATFSGELTCLLDAQKGLGSQLASLQFVLWRSKIEGKKPRIIDLRFDKPVIKY